MTHTVENNSDATINHQHSQTRYDEQDKRNIDLPTDETRRTTLNPSYKSRILLDPTFYISYRKQSRRPKHTGKEY